VTAYAPVLRLCRELVNRGVDPATPLEAYRGETLCLRVRSIGEGANLTVESDRCGCPVFRRRGQRRKRLSEYGQDFIERFKVPSGREVALTTETA